MDGGITQETAVEVAAAGANLLIAGSFLFRSQDMAAEIERMRQGAAEAFRI